jgi:hypothetical protein
MEYYQQVVLHGGVRFMRAANKNIKLHFWRPSIGLVIERKNGIP